MRIDCASLQNGPAQRRCLASNPVFRNGNVGYYHDLDHSLGVSHLADEVVGRPLSGLLHDFDPRPRGTPASVERTLAALDEPATRQQLQLELSPAELLRTKLDIAATDYPPNRIEFITRFRGLLEQLPAEERPAAIRQGALLAYADQSEIFTRPFPEAVRALRGLAAETAPLGGDGLAQVVAKAPSFMEAAGTGSAEVLQSIADSMGVPVRVPDQKEFLAMLSLEEQTMRLENYSRLLRLKDRAEGLEDAQLERLISEEAQPPGGSRVRAG